MSTTIFFKMLLEPEFWAILTVCQTKKSQIIII